MSSYFFLFLGRFTSIDGNLHTFWRRASCDTHALNIPWMILNASGPNSLKYSLKCSHEAFIIYQFMCFGVRCISVFIQQNHTICWFSSLPQKQKTKSASVFDKWSILKISLCDQVLADLLFFFILKSVFTYSSFFCRQHTYTLIYTLCFFFQFDSPQNKKSSLLFFSLDVVVVRMYTKYTQNRVVNFAEVWINTIEYLSLEFVCVSSVVCC